MKAFPIYMAAVGLILIETFLFLMVQNPVEDPASTKNLRIGDTENIEQFCRVNPIAEKTGIGYYKSESNSCSK